MSQFAKSLLVIAVVLFITGCELAEDVADVQEWKSRAIVAETEVKFYKTRLNALTLENDKLKSDGEERIAKIEAMYKLNRE